MGGGTGSRQAREGPKGKGIGSSLGRLHLLRGRGSSWAAGNEPGGGGVMGYMSPRCNIRLESLFDGVIFYFFIHIHNVYNVYKFFCQKFWEANHHPSPPLARGTNLAPHTLAYMCL
jgi:hypothetical protein